MSSGRSSAGWGLWLAKHVWSLEFDVPHRDLVELGHVTNMPLTQWYAAREALAQAGLAYEPITGTLYLRPYHGDPIWDTSAGFASSRIPLSDFNVAPAPSGSTTPVWAEQSIIASDSGHFMIRSQPPVTATLINILVLSGIEAIQTGANWQTTLHPIGQTKATFAANQGFWFQVEFPNDRVLHYDFLAIQFGQFLLRLHTSGTADLHKWSGTAWVWKTAFQGLPTPSGSPSMTGTATWRGVAQFAIMPFGRGHILFQGRSGGSQFSGVYTDPEAVWDSDNSLWQITSAAPLTLYSNLTDEKFLGWELATLKFRTAGSFYMPAVQMGYQPTTQPTLSAQWTQTAAGNTVALWLANGTYSGAYAGGSSYSLKLDLAGSGTSTPWLDAWSVSFPEKSQLVQPQTVTVPFAGNITEFRLQDGEGLDEQKICFTLRIPVTRPDLWALSQRGELTCRLLLDNLPVNTFLLRQPVVKCGKSWHHATFSGQSYGTAKLGLKKFYAPLSYANWTHPDVITSVLRQCGFATEDIAATAEEVRLPAAASGESGAETGEKQTGAEKPEHPVFNSEPAIFSPCRKFVEDVVANFSRWSLRWDCDETHPYGFWSYQPQPFPATGAHTFWPIREASMLETDAGYDGLSYEYEPAEANVVQLIGVSDAGVGIANQAIDWESVQNPAAPNYLGGSRPLIMIDPSINSQAVLDRVLLHLFQQVRPAVVWARWRGPYIPGIRAGDGVYLVTDDAAGQHTFQLFEVVSLAVESTRTEDIETGFGVLYTAKRYLANPITTGPEWETLGTSYAASKLGDSLGGMRGSGIRAGDRSHLRPERQMIGSLVQRVADEAGLEQAVRNTQTIQRDTMARAMSDLQRMKITWSSTPFAVGEQQ